MKIYEKIIETEAENISKRYKIEKEQAKEIFKSKLESCPFLLPEIKKAGDYQRLKKKKQYKKFIKKIRREIYYSLRRYHQDEKKEKQALKRLKDFAEQGGNTKKRGWPELRKKIISLHISSLEREPDINKFNQTILEIIKDDEYIFDIGSGFYPLSFPYGKARNLKKYICLEKDKKAIKVLKLFNQLADSKLIIFNHRIGQKDWSYYLPHKREKFDTVFMLKLIPVIKRQERKLLTHLAKVPACKIIITANKESMTKKQKIVRREDRALKEFIELSRRRIVRKLDFKNEFGYLIV